MRGVIDSEDLPLNVSREILQQNKVLSSIKTASVKKILSELKNTAANDKEKYAQFIAQYNRPLFGRRLGGTSFVFGPYLDLMRRPAVGHNGPAPRGESITCPFGNAPYRFRSA